VIDNKTAAAGTKAGSKFMARIHGKSGQRLAAPLQGLRELYVMVLEWKRADPLAGRTKESVEHRWGGNADRSLTHDGDPTPIDVNWEFTRCRVAPTR
jgi:hypothetical protein